MVGGKRTPEGVVGGKRVLIDADGKVVQYAEDKGMRPGLQSLRTQKMHWNLTDYIEAEEKYTYTFRAEKRKFCAQASLDTKSCQSLQTYMSTIRFNTSRCAILYGSFIDSEAEAERKKQEEEDKKQKAFKSQYGNNKKVMKLGDLKPQDELLAKQAVRVEAIYEPPQENQSNSFTLLQDEREEKVEAIAKSLGLQRVGFLVAHADREDYNFSTQEILTCAEQALEATEGERESPFVVIKVSPKDGFEAFSLTPMCLDMVAEGALIESDSAGVSAVHESFKAVVENKEAKVIDNDLFILRVPIVQHDSPISGSGTFPRYNREFAEAPSATNVKAALKGLGRNPSPTDLAKALADFHVLVHLSQVFDIDQGLTEIATWVADYAFKGETPKPLPEGYKLLIMNMAGLD